MILDVKRNIVLLIFLSLMLTQQITIAQYRKSSSSPPTYEELYDAPYDINKLFVQFQPLYGELFVTNINVGFGLEATYYWDEKMHFKAHARKAYAPQFDFTRYNAEKNKHDLQVYEPSIFNYFEVGATYHIKDEEMDTETKFILYSKRYKGNKWAAKVPDHIKAPTKVRRILGARLGGITYKSSFDLRRTINDQGILLGDSSNQIIQPESTLYGNLTATGGYVGASYTWIKNVAIKFDKTYGVAISDLIFTSYFDILVMPLMTIEDTRYKPDPLASHLLISSEPIETNKIGFRLGMEGKFNREFGWAYNAEIGMRPSVKTRSFYAVVKISFPVFATSLSHEVEAFGK